jgi:hypothetical protein
MRAAANRAIIFDARTPKPRQILNNVWTVGDFSSRSNRLT